MKKGAARGIGPKVVILLLLVLVASRMLSHGVSDYFMASAYDGSDTAIDTVLSWHANNSKGLYLKAKSLETTDPEQARALIYRALYQSPADVRPLAVLARIMAARGSSDEADHLMTLASNAMPANKSLHLRAANYWIERLDLARALHEWHLALSINPGLGNQLFPIFLRVLENPEISGVLQDYALEPPVWWDGFVAHVKANAQQATTARLLYDYRKQSHVTLSPDERQQLVERSIRDQQWKQAYLIWVEGLSPAQRKYLGGLYDGSFELTRDQQSFGWQLKSTRYTVTQVRPSYGVDGQSALMVKFNEEELHYRHLHQRLLLPPGEYLLTADKRTQKLSGRGRLRWFMRCADSNGKVIAESRPILPSMEWEQMQFTFQVPAGDACESQLLQLESVGKRPFDHKLSGVLWMDNVRIERTRAGHSG